MTPLFPRVQEVENIFHKILASKEACARLRETFNSSLEDFQGSEELNNETFSKVVLDSYSNQDISALLLAICGKSMFDLLRDAYLIPQTFHGKAGENPVLLTSPSGDLLEGKDVSHHTMRRFKSILSQHQPVPRSLVYLADGYDIERYYKHDGSVDQRKTDAVRGILLLYALPDTKKLHLTTAQFMQSSGIHSSVFKKKHLLLVSIMDRKQERRMIKTMMKSQYYFLLICLEDRWLSIWKSLMD